MKELSNDQVVLSAIGQNLLRILIASYFLAVAIGLIPGTNLSILTGKFLPANLAGPVASMFVFGMAYLVMIGVWLRGSALLLGTVTFWASYLKMIELGMEHELGAFWRDLALIAALMLTYCDRDPRDSNKRGIVRRRIVPRKVAKPHPAFVNAVAALPGVTHSEMSEDTRLVLDEAIEAAQRDRVSMEELENIFREDFKLARSP